MKVSTKLLLSHFSILTLFIIFAGWIFHGYPELIRITSLLAEMDLREAQVAGGATYHLEQVRSEIQEAYIALRNGDQADRQEAAAKAQHAYARFQHRIQEWRDVILREMAAHSAPGESGHEREIDREKRELASVNALADDASRMMTLSKALLAEGPVAEDALHWKDMADFRHFYQLSQDNVRQHWEEADHEVRDELAERLSALEHTITYHFRSGLAGFAVALALGLVVSLRLSRMIIAPLNELRSFAAKVGRGERDALMATDGGDEFEEVAGAFNAMVHDLDDTTVLKTHFEVILNSMADALLVSDGLGRILQANRAAARLWRRDENAWEGTSMNTLLPPQAWEEARAAITRGQGLPFCETVILPEKDNGIPVHMVVSPLGGEREGDAAEWVWMLKDVTELKKSQEHLIQSERLATIGGLVAGVAHEINTPVGIGVTATSNLRTTTQDITRAFQERAMTKPQLETYLADVAEMADLILNNLSRTAELVESFKMVSADQTSLERRRFDLGGYLHSLAASLKPRFKNSPVTLKIDCPDGIEMDSFPGGLAQVITNLVINALNHAFSGDEPGQIRISARIQGDDEVAINVNDNGRGIARQDLKRIFTPFYTTARESGGTGLGLSVVASVIHNKLKGGIHCESAPGQGSTFYIQLPLRP